MGSSSVKLHIPTDHCLKGPWNLQVVGSLFHWNTVEQNGISGNMCILVHMFMWNIPPFIYYLFVISYSPKKLKLPSVFCHFRTWGSAAAASLWFSWHIFLSFTWIFLFQSSNTSCGTALRAGHSRHCWLSRVQAELQTPEITHQQRVSLVSLCHSWLAMDVN